jgi:hypothetical protein
MKLSKKRRRNWVRVCDRLPPVGKEVVVQVRLVVDYEQGVATLEQDGTWLVNGWGTVEMAEVCQWFLFPKPERRD